MNGDSTSRPQVTATDMAYSYGYGALDHYGYSKDEPAQVEHAKRGE